MLPLVPYLDTLRWMFIAAALAGIAAAIYTRWAIGTGESGDRCRRGAYGPATGEDGAPLGAVALTVCLFLLSLRRAGECAERMAERLEIMERDSAADRRVHEAAARGPHGRDELVRQLRDGRF